MRTTPNLLLLRGWLVLALLCPAILSPSTGIAPVESVLVVSAFAQVKSVTEQSREWQELRQQMAPLEGARPAQVIEKYRQFAASLGKALSPSLGVQVFDAIIYLQAENLNDPTAAVRTAAYAYQTYQKLPEATTLLARWANVLLQAGKPAEAEALVAGHAGNVAAAGPIYGSRALRPYLTALIRQDKKERFIDVFSRNCLEYPGLLDEIDLWDAMNAFLMESQRLEEAQQWAKLRFQVCAYDSIYIERATHQLVAPWLMQDAKLIQGFVQSQRDRRVENPLSKVTPISFKDIQSKALSVEQIVEAAQELKTNEHERFSLMIAAGSPGALRTAMTDAVTWLSNNPSPLAIVEVLRLLKASDLNVQRAHTFVEFVKSGKGENPLRSYFKEPGAESAATTALLQKVEAQLANKRSELSKLPILNSMPPVTATVVPAVLFQVRLGSLAVEKAYASGDLTLPDVLWVLNQGYTGAEAGDAAVRRSLLKILVEQGGERVTASRDGSGQLRFALVEVGAGGKAPVQDARAKELLASIINDAPPAVVAPVADAPAAGPATPAVVAQAPAGSGAAGQARANFIADGERAKARKLGESMVKQVRAAIVAGETEKARTLLPQLEKLELDALQYGKPGSFWQRAQELVWLYRQVGLEEQAVVVMPRVVAAIGEVPIRPNDVEMQHQTMEAARWLSERGEDQAKVDAYYAKASSYNGAYVKSIVQLDQARTLLDQNKQEEGLDILRRLIDCDVPDTRSEAAMILGRYYLKRANISQAHQYAQIAVDAYNNKPPKDSVRAFVAAKKFLSTVSQWQKTPFVCEPATVAVNANEVEKAIELNKPLIKRLKVQSFRPLLISVASNHPDIKVTVLPDSDWGEVTNDIKRTKEVMMQIEPAALKKGLDALITMTGTEFTDFVLSVPVTVTLQ